MNISDVLNLGGKPPDLPGIEGFRLHFGRGADTELGYLVFHPGLHEANRVPGLDAALEDAKQNDDTTIGIVITVENQGFQGSVAFSFRGRDVPDDFLQNFRNAKAGLGGHIAGFATIDANPIFDVVLDAIWHGGRQIDFVDHGEQV